MPLYRFKNIKTGRIFDKFLTFEEHDLYRENKNLMQVPTGFKIAHLISSGENKIREQLWNAAQAGKRQQTWKDNRG